MNQEIMSMLTALCAQVNTTPATLPTPPVPGALRTEKVAAPTTPFVEDELERRLKLRQEVLEENPAVPETVDLTDIQTNEEQ